MRSDCTAAKGRLQFWLLFRQSRWKILFRRDPRPKAVHNFEDDLIPAEGLDGVSLDPRLEDARSRLGWGITHI